MKITNAQKVTSSTDGVFIFLSSKTTLVKSLGISKNIQEEITTRIEEKDFSFETGEILQMFTRNDQNKQKIFLIGIENAKKPEDTSAAANSALKKAKKLRLSNISFVVPKEFDFKRIIVGVILGGYNFKITNEKTDVFPDELEIVTEENIEKEIFEDEIVIAEAANYTRHLIDLPPNMMTPTILAEEAIKLGKGLRNPVKVKVYGEKDMKKMDMGALLGVGQGSHEESKLIVLEYKGGSKDEEPIALVGKAVCFDAGGYNLKPTNSIEDMKSDMAGGATVLGLFKWILEQRPEKNVVGVIGAVENLVSGHAFKPGDILTAMNGKTVEIGNTDAEGRLVLADCLCFANEKFKPAKMVDIATLTGAVIVALGTEITGIMGNNKKLIGQIKKAADKAAEKVWELPINDTFRDNMKGICADLSNVSKNGKNGGGSSNGGAFLENFVGKTPWIHLDLGGTAFGGKYNVNASEKGATGAMVRTLKNFLADN